MCIKNRNNNDIFDRSEIDVLQVQIHFYFLSGGKQFFTGSPF